MSEKKRGLGRGLSALIGEAGEQAVQPTQSIQSTQPMQDASQAESVVADNVSPSGSEKPAAPQRLGVDQLQPGKFQPRKNFDTQDLEALAASVSKSGVLQPLLVRPIAGQDTMFEIIAGERRWRAAQKAKLHDVPVIVQNINDVTALEIGIIENVQRADLNLIEEAEGYQRLIDEFAYTQAELAETIGKSRSHIANLLRLTDAPDAVRAALIDGAISMGHARALLSADNSPALVKQIIAEGLSVRAVEKLAAEKKSGGTSTANTTSADKGFEKNADTRALEKTIADSLGLRVAIDDKGGDKGGDLRLSYKTLEQLDDLVARLIGRP